MNRRSNILIGAIAGDIIGSVYEFRPIKSVNFSLFKEYSRFTDDTVMTVANADWLLTHEDLVDVMKRYGNNYPAAGYGGMFMRWLMSDNPRPYNSYGNGSAMRVSPVGWAFDTLEETLEKAKESAAITHDHPEGLKGARAVVESGLFQKYDIAEIYGAHTEPMLEKGVFGFRVGPLQASCDYFWLSIKGKSTHGGRPHLGIDPVPAAAELINSAQSIISRKVNPIDTAVLSICAVNAGRYETPNVVPNEVKISGTARTFQPATRKLVEETFKAMLENIARAHGCTSEIKYEHSIPSVINDEAATKAAVAVAEKLFGSAAVRPNIDPFMSSEDFAEYQQIVPGCMMRVGVRDEEHTSSVHSTSFDFNDEVLPAAVALLAGIARSRLEALGN